MSQQIDDLLGQLPIDDIAAKLGVNPKEAMAAASQALPALFGKMASNTSEGGGDALKAALKDHVGNEKVSIEEVDTKDGEKIVAKVFGDGKEETIKAFAGGADASLITKMLPMLAPLVMGYLANSMFSGKSSDKKAPSTQAGTSDMLGSLLESLTGSASSKPGATKKGAPKSGGLGALGDMLGGLLGGK